MKVKSSLGLNWGMGGFLIAYLLGSYIAAVPATAKRGGNREFLVGVEIGISAFGGTGLAS